MEELKCYICEKPAIKYKVNLVLCNDCIQDYEELSKYITDTPTMRSESKKTFKKCRKKMQEILDKLVPDLDKRRNILKDAWKMFSNAFGNNFCVGRSYEDAIYISIYIAGKNNDYLLLSQDLISSESIVYKKQFNNVFYKNLQAFKKKVELKVNLHPTSVRSYLDLAIRKMKPDQDKINIINSIYDNCGGEAILNKNINVDTRSGYYSNVSTKKLKPNVVAAIIYYIATSEIQVEISKVLHVSTVSIQHHYREFQRLYVTNS